MNSALNSINSILAILSILSILLGGSQNLAPDPQILQNPQIPRIQFSIISKRGHTNPDEKNYITEHPLLIKNEFHFRQWGVPGSQPPTDGGPGRLGPAPAGRHPRAGPPAGAGPRAPAPDAQGPRQWAAGIPGPPTVGNGIRFLSKGGVL